MNLLSNSSAWAAEKDLDFSADLDADLTVSPGSIARPSSGDAFAMCRICASVVLTR